MHVELVVDSNWEELETNGQTNCGDEKLANETRLKEHSKSVLRSSEMFLNK